MTTKEREPLISIVTVVFNGSAHIEETIKSVINQSYRNIQYIIIDGGSTDGTLEILEKYKKHFFHCHSGPDRGIYDAMNKGIAAATGEWINFMNAGDRFASNDVLEIFRDPNLDADIAYGDALIEYPSFKTVYTKFPLSQLWKKMPFCHQAMFAKTALMRQYMFDTTYRLSADFDFIYKAWLAEKKFQYVPRLICLFDFTKGASVSNALKSIEERKRISLKHKSDIFRKTYYFFFMTYINFSLRVKKIIGSKPTAWLTKFLRA